MALLPHSLDSLKTKVGVGDACLLHPLTEDAFIENLRQRYRKQQIYVSIQILF